MPETTRIVTLPNGQRVEITGDREPTQEDLQAIMASLPPPSSGSLDTIRRRVTQGVNQTQLGDALRAGAERLGQIPGQVPGLIRGFRDIARGAMEESGQAQIAEGQAGAEVAPTLIRGVRDAAAGAGAGEIAEGEARMGMGPELVRGLRAELPQMGPNAPRATRGEGPQAGGVFRAGDVELPREDYSTPFQQYGPGRLTQAPTPGSTGEADAGLSDPAAMFRQNVGQVAEFLTGVPGAGSYSTQALKEGWQSLDPIGQGLAMLNVIGQMPLKGLAALTARTMGVNPEQVGRVSERALRKFWTSQDAAGIREKIAQNVDEVIRNREVGIGAGGTLGADELLSPEQMGTAPAGRMRSILDQAIEGLDTRFGPTVERATGQAGEALRGAGRQVRDVVGGARDMATVYRGMPAAPRAPALPRTAPLEAPTMADDLLREPSGGGVDVVEAANAAIRAAEKEAAARIRGYRSAGWAPKVLQRAIAQEEKALAARSDQIMADALAGRAPEVPATPPRPTPEAAGEAISEGVGLTPSRTPIEAPAGAGTPPAAADRGTQRLVRLVNEGKLSWDHAAEVAKRQEGIDFSTIMPRPEAPAAAAEAAAGGVDDAAVEAFRKQQEKELVEWAKVEIPARTKRGEDWHPVMDEVNAELERRVQAFRGGVTEPAPALTATATPTPPSGGGRAPRGGRKRGSEAGFAKLFTDPAANVVGLTGGTIGGSLGALGDEENPLRGAVKGAIAGAIPGIGMNEARIFREGVDAIQGAPFKTAAARTARYLDQARQGSMLSGMAPVKSLFGAGASVPIRAAETALMGEPRLALRQIGDAIRATPQGLRDAAHVIATGESPMFLPSTNVHPAKGLFGLPRYVMGTTDAPFRRMQMEMTPTAEDINWMITKQMKPEDLAARELLSGTPQTTALRSAGNFLRGKMSEATAGTPKDLEEMGASANKWGPAVRHAIFPVGYTTTANAAEQGAQRIPGVNFLTQALVPSLEQTGRQMGANTVMGLGAMGAGAATDAAVPQEDYLTRGGAASLAGKYMVPFGMGMAANRFLNDPDAGPMEAADLISEQLNRDIAPRFSRLFGRNPASNYLDSLNPAIWKLFTGER